MINYHSKSIQTMTSKIYIKLKKEIFLWKVRHFIGSSTRFRLVRHPLLPYSFPKPILLLLFTVNCNKLMWTLSTIIPTKCNIETMKENRYSKPDTYHFLSAFEARQTPPSSVLFPRTSLSLFTINHNKLKPTRSTVISAKIQTIITTQKKTPRKEW